MRLRRSRDTEGLESGERVLAGAQGPDGTVLATNRGLRLPAVDGAGAVIEWSGIESATWDGDEQTLVVIEAAGESGRRQRRAVTLDEPGRLVDVVREQVTASVLVSRHVPVSGGLGARVTGRRTHDGEIVWSAQLDAGLDLDAPGARERVDAAIAAVRNEVE